MKKQTYFITAIGTDSGKTLISSILVEALQADYWKPVQSGHPRDTDTVKEWVDSQKLVFHKEAYLLKEPMSPHAAAKIDGVDIDINQINLPTTDNHLIVEGAGGLLVPLNDQDFVVDLIKKLNIPLILVANLYLGSINHTLLSIEAIKSRDLEVKGIIFNGNSNPESERIIEKYAGWEVLLRVPQEENTERENMNKYIKTIQKKLIPTSL